MADEKQAKGHESGFFYAEDKKDESDNSFIQLYASLMIILMTFFIVIYSYSSYSRAKFELAKDSLYKIFETIGITNSLEIMSILKSKRPADEDGAKERRKIVISLSEISKSLQKELGGVAVDLKRRETRIIVPDKKLFEKTLSFSEAGKDILDRIVNYISKDDYTNIIIASHYMKGKNRNMLVVDDPSWILSTLRAVLIGDYFIKKGIPEDKITAAGFGNLHPLEDDNYYIEGVDVSNTRVEIIIKKPIITNAENYDLVV